MKAILIGFISITLLLSCSGKNKQLKEEMNQQTESVDTNRIYEIWEVDTPPAQPN